MKFYQLQGIRLTGRKREIFFRTTVRSYLGYQTQRLELQGNADEIHRIFASIDSFKVRNVMQTAAGYVTLRPSFGLCVQTWLFVFACETDYLHLVSIDGGQRKSRWLA